MNSQPDTAVDAEQPPSPVLEFDRVTFGYSRVPVLREASLRVQAGEFVAVIGSNGAGKTTLMRLGLGLLHPAHGQVRLFGKPLREFREWGKVGYIPQRATGATTVPVNVEEAVRTGLAGHLGLFRRPTAEHRARIEHVLDLTGLTRLRDDPLTELSGGQLQRALIARALVTAPRLLILDEPTTGVDSSGRDMLRASLQYLVDEEGVAVVYVSHDPEGFTGLADRVIELRAGRPVRCEDPAAHGHPHVWADSAPAEQRSDRPAKNRLSQPEGGT